MSEPSSPIISQYTLTINEENNNSEELSLESLRNPHIFDRVKHQLDQSQFFSLLDLIPYDAILQCRKAELLIYLENDNEAFDLLKDNPLLLARGLEAKLYVSLNQAQKGISLVWPHFMMNEKQALEEAPIDQEGHVHIFEMTAILAFRQSNFLLAKHFIDLADVLAEHLDMQGRLVTLRTFAKDIYRRLGLNFDKTCFDSGSYKSRRFQALVDLRHTWLAGQPDFSSEVPDEYKYVIEVWQSFQEGRHYLTEGQIKALDTRGSNGEVRVHQALLSLHFILRTKIQKYGIVGECINNLGKELEAYPERAVLIQEIVQLHPLAVLVAAERLPILAEVVNQVPLLANEKYRDGLRWKHQILVLPLHFRRAWLEDDLYPSHVSELSLIDRTTRYRAMKVLKQNKILRHQIVSVVSYYQACENLVSLGYTDYQKVSRKLKELYPKSLRKL